MASKCRNIWDTLRGDVTTTCSPTPSCCLDAVSAEPSRCLTELQPLTSNSSRRNCDVRDCSAVLETACLLRQNAESSAVNSAASNSAKTFAVPCSISTNFTRTPLSANRDVTCNKGCDSFVHSSRLSVSCRDACGAVQECLSTNRPKIFQKRAAEFPGDTVFHDEPLSLLNVLSANSVDVSAVQERRKQSDACVWSDLCKSKCSWIKSRGETNESFANNGASDIGSVGAGLGHGVDNLLDPFSFFDHLPTPGVLSTVPAPGVMSTASDKHCTAKTKPKQSTIRNDHDTNSVADKDLPGDVMQQQMTTAPGLRSGYLTNYLKRQLPGVKTENLSNAGDIPLFSSPFDTAPVNGNNSNVGYSSLSEYCRSKMSHLEDVRSGVCDLVSSVNCSNDSLCHISRTSVSDVSESESRNSLAEGVILPKELGYAEGKAQRGVNDRTSLNDSGGACDDETKVDAAYVVMMGDSAYRKLQYFYTSSKNSNNDLSYPVTKSDSESFPDCCDEGFVESPMTTDDVMESTNDIDGDRSLQIPADTSDRELYESTRMLTKDESAFDGIPIAIKSALRWLEADTSQKPNALLETNIMQETNVQPKSDKERLTETLTSKFHAHDCSQKDGESIGRNPVDESEVVVEVCADNNLIVINQSSHSSATGGDVTCSKDSTVSDVHFSYCNSVHDFANGTVSRGDVVFESDSSNCEIDVANPNACQTHLAITTKIGVSQCISKVSSHPPLEINQTENFNEIKLNVISSKLLPASSELNTTVCVGDSSIFNNVASPSISTSGTNECFPCTSTFLPQAMLCPLRNVTTDSSNGSLQNSDDSCILQKYCHPFKTQKVDDVLLSDFKTEYDFVRSKKCDGGHSSSDSSCEDKSCDNLSKTSRSRSEEEQGDCKSEENFGAFANKRMRKTSRQPRLLNEIANTVGFIADKRQSQHSDSLFIDSKLLSREERVLQMVHMQITKMEVKEELTKLKKIKSFSDSTDQDNKSERREPASDHRFSMTPRRLVQRRIKACVGRTSKCRQLFSQRQTLHNRRIRQNVWSSRAIRVTDLWGTAVFKREVRQSSRARRRPTMSMKSRAALQTCFREHFQVQYSPHRTGSKSRGRWRSTISASRTVTELLTSKTFPSDGGPPSTGDFDTTPKRMNRCSDEPASATELETACNDVHNFSSTTEYSQGHATPVVPLEVKRLIACHNTGETVLHKASRLGYPNIVLWCCQSRYVDIDTTDNAGYTPLHESCIGSEVSIARHLLHYGAKINVASGVDGRRPIHEAVDSDSLEMVRLLLSAGADINLTTYSGKTVQDLAKSPEMKDFIKAYLDDLNGVKDEDKEVVWDLAPVWNGVSDECGMDLFYDLPTWEPKSEEFNVECSNRPL